MLTTAFCLLLSVIIYNQVVSILHKNVPQFQINKLELLLSDTNSSHVRLAVGEEILAANIAGESEEPFHSFHGYFVVIYGKNMDMAFKMSINSYHPITSYVDMVSPYHWLLSSSSGKLDLTHPIEWKDVSGISKLSPPIDTSDFISAVRTFDFTFFQGVHIVEKNTTIIHPHTCHDFIKSTLFKLDLSHMAPNRDDFVIYGKHVRVHTGYMNLFRYWTNITDFVQGLDPNYRMKEIREYVTSNPTIFIYIGSIVVEVIEPDINYCHDGDDPHVFCVFKQTNLTHLYYKPVTGLL